MRTHWWQSIRWRLALGSTLVALLATALLALLIILAIPYYYGMDQRAQLTDVASRSAQHISANYAQVGNLIKIFQNSRPSIFANTSESEGYVFVVVDHSNHLVFPDIRVKNALAQRVIIARFLNAAVDPSLRVGDYSKISQAVVSGQHGNSVIGDIGESNVLGTTPRLFAVQPIFAGAKIRANVVGVLIVIPRSVAENTTPTFLAALRQSILITSAIVAVLAALVAILFSRTITRPLERLTNTAHVLSSGDYSARVRTNAQGELGELADTFNTMAERLEADVNELYQQEVWRRELIMNITHDLATPLTAIAGLGESLVDGVNVSREDYEATGQIIVRETLRLRRLVKDLHMMAKVEAGALHPDCKPVRLAALVDEVLAVLAPEFERANVEPLNKVPYNIPLVLIDADMLSRVFSNLCGNALRYTPAGGIIEIEAAERNSMLEVSVTDSGDGIPPEALLRVFDRFYRADSARQAVTGGSGLGLAIVQAIIEAHGGHVRAENAEKGGARIVFTLPLADVQKKLPGESKTQPLPLSAP